MLNNDQYLVYKMIDQYFANLLLMVLYKCKLLIYSLIFLGECKLSATYILQQSEPQCHLLYVVTKASYKP